MTTREFPRPRIESSPLYNRDLAPTTSDRRHWGTYNYAALWVSMSVNILTYMLAASLIQGGMNWKQAVATVFLGNTVVLIPMLLNSHPGARYGIPFPVLARASFGVLGANLAAVLRALVACGWFGIQTWIGGTALASALEALNVWHVRDTPFLDVSKIGTLVASLAAGIGGSLLLLHTTPSEEPLF